MIDLTDRDKAVLMDVVDFFYKQGGVRNRQMVADLDSVVAKLIAKPERKEAPSEPDGKPGKAE